MKAKIYVLLFLFTLPIITIAQSNYYYYYKGERKNLTLDKKHLNINVLQSFQKSSIENQNAKLSSLENDFSDQEKILKIEYQTEFNDNAFFKKLDELRNQSNIKNVSLYFKRNNTTSIGTSDIFYIKLKSINDFNALQTIANQKNVTIIHQNKFMPLWYKLKLNPNSTKTSIELSNEFYETDLFQDVDPAFMFNFEDSCSNDDDFGSLWGLNNDSNPDIDINICDAWTITEGNGINVAVLDQGVFKTHDDLSSNISSLSYDTQSGSSPSIFTSGRDHGTHVSGTIAAVKDNDLQVVGVAPQSEIMSISHTLSITPDISEELADGINWAWQNGADVINNSWGDQGGSFYGQLHSSVLENAIINAMTNGRNGNGTLVVFASGNQSPAIDYPASFHNDILCVGAITSSGSRSPFSGHGNELDVVAPGSNILSTIPNQNTASWNGTSMAAPHVTGIIALILSVNPDLALQDVSNIIESTAQKVGGYSYVNNPNRTNGTWHEQMGYGLVDAFSAVQMAINYNNQSHFITGPTQLTPGYRAFYSMNSYPNATNYVWSIPTGCHYHYCWGITQGQGTNVLGIKAGNTGIQDITCTIYNGSTIIGSQYITVNVQNPYGGGGGGGNGDPCGGIETIDNLILPPEPCDDIGLSNGTSESIYFKKVVIYNLLGQVVLETKKKEQANISHLSSGIYIVKAELSNNEIITKKIYKNN